jgi:hypothetical protein
MHSSRALKLLVVALLVLLIVPAVGEERPIVEISVLTSGELLVDGQPSDMQQLEAALERAREAGGAVWYYRENGLEEASPQAMRVIQLVIDKRLPISMSSKPDFSDYIDGKGRSHPRRPQ